MLHVMSCGASHYQSTTAQTCTTKTKCYWMQLVESTREDSEGEALTFKVGAGDVFANEMIKARRRVLQMAPTCLDDPTQLSMATQHVVCRQWMLRCGAWQLVTKPGWK